MHTTYLSFVGSHSLLHSLRVELLIPIRPRWAQPLHYNLQTHATPQQIPAQNPYNLDLQWRWKKQRRIKIRSSYGGIGGGSDGRGEGRDRKQRRRRRRRRSQEARSPPAAAAWEDAGFRTGGLSIV